jgi:hypothetical protein
MTHWFRRSFYAVSGCRLHKVMSGICRRCKSCTFALRLPHPRTLVTSGMYENVEVPFSHASEDWKFKITVSWCGETSEFCNVKYAGADGGFSEVTRGLNQRQMELHRPLDTSRKKTQIRHNPNELTIERIRLYFWVIEWFINSLTPNDFIYIYIYIFLYRATYLTAVGLTPGGSSLTTNG